MRLSQALYNKSQAITNEVMGGRNYVAGQGVQKEEMLRTQEVNAARESYTNNIEKERKQMTAAGKAQKALALHQQEKTAALLAAAQLAKEFKHKEAQKTSPQTTTQTIDLGQAGNLQVKMEGQERKSPPLGKRSQKQFGQQKNKGLEAMGLGSVLGRTQEILNTPKAEVSLQAATPEARELGWGGAAKVSPSKLILGGVGAQSAMVQLANNMGKSLERGLNNKTDDVVKGRQHDIGQSDVEGMGLN